MMEPTDSKCQAEGSFFRLKAIIARKKSLIGPQTLRQSLIGPQTLLQSLIGQQTLLQSLIGQTLLLCVFPSGAVSVGRGGHGAVLSEGEAEDHGPCSSWRCGQVHAGRRQHEAEGSLCPPREDGEDG